MIGYFSKLADRSGLSEKHSGDCIHPAVHTKHGWDHRKVTDEVTDGFTEQIIVGLPPSDGRKTFSNSDSMPEISHPAASYTAEQGADLPQHKLNESDPGHDQAPIADTERRINKQQITDLPEATTIYQTCPDYQSSMVEKVLSSTVPIRNLALEQTEAASRPKAISPVTDSAVSEIQRKSITPAIGQSRIEAYAPQTVSGHREPLGGQKAVFQKNREVSIPESQGPRSGAIERTTSLPKAINNDQSSVSKQPHEAPMSVAYTFRAASLNSMNQDDLVNTNRKESSTGQSVEIRIGTLSFEIRQDPTTINEPPQPNDLIKTQKPYHSVNNTRLQTQAHHLSRHYLRGY